MMEMKRVLLLLIVATLAACGGKPPEQKSTDAATAGSQGAADTNDEAKNDAAIQKLHRSIGAIDRQPFATPPRLVLTLNGSGWDEAALFYGFAGDAHSVLEKMSKKGLLPQGHDLVFILRAESTDSQKRNILHLQVPGAAVTEILSAGNSTAALLEGATIDFNGRMGRDVVATFCDGNPYQGTAGLMPTPEFCRQATAD